MGGVLVSSCERVLGLLAAAVHDSTLLMGSNFPHLMDGICMRRSSLTAAISCKYDTTLFVGSYKED